MGSEKPADDFAVKKEYAKKAQECLAQISEPGGANFADLVDGDQRYEGRYVLLGETDLIIPRLATSLGQARECYVKLGDREHFYLRDATGLHQVTPEELIIGPVSLSQIQHLLLCHLMSRH